jgi:gluconolactonase
MPRGQSSPMGCLVPNEYEHLQGMTAVVRHHARFAEGLDQPEGPVFLADGSLVLAEMGEGRACVTLFKEGGKQVLARPGGRPTGLAADGDGCIWVAGSQGNALVRLAPSGEIIARIEGDAQGPFLFPNDLAFGPDGLLYMTDSGMVPGDLIRGLDIREDFATAHYDGRLFQIDPRSARVLRRLTTGLRFANGLAFGRDAALYFNETLTGTIYRQEIGRAPEVFARTASDTATACFCGPDGMAFDRAGDLFCAQYGEGRIAVYAEDGTEKPSIPTDGDRPTNLAFQPGSSHLFVTEVEHGAVEVVSVQDPGLALHAPEIGL